MYVVIFKAAILELDGEYKQTAAAMRELAFAKYHCLGFEACAENGQEIALSYWNSLDDIAAWRHDLQHQGAQKQGMARWYRHCHVEIAEIVRQYARSNES